MSTDASGYASATVGGLTVSTNDGSSAEEITEAISDPKPSSEPEKDPVSEAARTLGEKGGKAAAKARAKAEKEAKQEAKDAEPELDERGEPSEQSETEGEKPLGKPRHDPRARVQEATREAAEARRLLQAERAERERLARELEQARAGTKPPDARPAGPSPDKEPNPEDYEAHADYIRDLTKYHTRQAQAEVRREQEIRQRAEAFAHSVGSAVTLYQDRMLEARKTDPNFGEVVDEVLGELPRPMFLLDQDTIKGMSEGEQALSYMAQLIVQSEMSTEMLRHFAANRDEFQRIANAATPAEMVRAMARLEGKLSRDEKPKVEAAATAGASVRPPISKAPPPVRPVTGAPSAADLPDVDPDDIPFSEFMRREDAREKARRARAR